MYVMGDSMEFKKVFSENDIFLIGMDFYGDPFEKASTWEEENEIGQLWKRFNKFILENPDSMNNVNSRNVFYEVHSITDESFTKGYFNIFVGVQTETVAAGIPFGLVAKQLPPSKYALFTLKGQEIASDWNRQIMSDWAPSSGLELLCNYTILKYDDRFKGMDKIDESEMDILIPIR